MDDETSNVLREYINLQTPLGPIAAEDIENDEVSAHLFDRHNSSFNNLITSDIDIVVGRRGSGKTALLKCYRLANVVGRGKTRAKDAAMGAMSGYTMVIEISSAQQFHKMQSIVIGDNKVFKPIELVVTDWADLIGDLILTEVVQRLAHINSEELQRISAFLSMPLKMKEREAEQTVWGRAKKDKDINVPTTKHEALMLLEEYLKSTGSRVAVIFDSMEEYQVGNPVADRTIGALLRHLRKFNSIYRRIRIKAGLPSETFPEIQQTSANPLKDLVRVEHITWTSMELMQMAAHRYRLFLQLHDQVAFNRFSELDFNQRVAVNRFWNSVFKGQIKASEVVFEHPITFILRHTQLLPRQFLVILTKIVLDSYNETGGVRELKNALVLLAVEKNNIPVEIYSAYKEVYPEASRIARALFGNFPPVFVYEELEERWKRVGRPLSYTSGKAVTEFFEAVEMFLRMGVLGVVTNTTDKYIDADYSYQNKEIVNTGLKGRLCVHPIFTRELGCDVSQQQQVVRPSGVSFQIEATE